MDMEQRAEAFIAQAKAKIEAAFADTPDHVSATISDIKLLAMTLLEHMVCDERGHPEEPPAGTPLTLEELEANGLNPDGTPKVVALETPADPLPSVSDGGGAPPAPPVSDGGGAPPPPEAPPAPPTEA